MPEDNFESYEDEFIDDTKLAEIKSLVLTRNEALFLSDTVTLLMEHIADPGKAQLPMRHLLPQAVIPVPIDLIQKIGFAVLLTTDRNDIKSQAPIDVTIADLFLLRECCQSYIKVNQELVGFNLLRKIYELILERDLKERQDIERITKDIDTSVLNRTNIEELRRKYTNHLKNITEKNKDE